MPVHHLDGEPIHLDDRVPIGHAGSAQWIGPDLQPGPGDGLQVDDVTQIRHVRRDIVILMRGTGLERPCQGPALDLSQAVHQDLVGAVLDRLGDGRVCRPG